MVAGHFYLDINPWHMIYLCFPYLILWIRNWLGFVPSKTFPEGIALGLLAGLPLAYFVYDVGIHAAHSIDLVLRPDHAHPPHRFAGLVSFCDHSSPQARKTISLSRAVRSCLSSLCISMIRSEVVRINSICSGPLCWARYRT